MTIPRGQRWARQRQWARDRQEVAEAFFDGDVDAAETLLLALPYSAIPSWQDVVTVIETYRELVGLPDQGPTGEPDGPTSALDEGDR